MWTGRSGENARCEVPQDMQTVGEIRKDIPIMLYDGDCGFCKRSVDKWQKKTGDKIQYIPYQFFAADESGRLKDLPQIQVSDCKRSVQLVMSDGARCQAAGAVFQALSYAGKQKWLLLLYRYFPGFKFVAEIIYSFIARHRYLF